jgi:hypothetical protein
MKSTSDAQKKNFIKNDMSMYHVCAHIYEVKRMPNRYQIFIEKIRRRKNSSYLGTHHTEMTRIK